MEEQRDKVEADGALRRCFCGRPIWFDAGRPSTVNTYQADSCWRNADGTPHLCPEASR